MKTVLSFTLTTMLHNCFTLYADILNKTKYDKVLNIYRYYLIYKVTSYDF